MANPNKAFFVGTDAVMNWYDLNAKTPYWSIIDSKGTMLYQSQGDDAEENRQTLEDNIRVAQNAGMNGTLTLKIHPKKEKQGYFDSKSAHIIATYFRPCEYEMSVPANVGYMQPNISQELASLRAEIASLRMQQHTEDIEEDDNEDEEPPSFLSGLMQNPQIQAMILSSLSGILNPQTKVTNVAGVHSDVDLSEDEKIYEAIERLKKVSDTLGNDLLLLCQMAENDPMQFNFLLKMLRK